MQTKNANESVSNESVQILGNADQYLYRCCHKETHESHLNVTGPNFPG